MSRPKLDGRGTTRYAASFLGSHLHKYIWAKIALVFKIGLGMYWMVNLVELVEAESMPGLAGGVVAVERGNSRDGRLQGATFVPLQQASMFAMGHKVY